MKVEGRRMTHADLVDLGRRILSGQRPGVPHCEVVVTELASYNGSLGGETPDVFGIGRYGAAVIECKTSRADFLRDTHKLVRREPERGMGEYRYYLVPDGMLSPAEVPEAWGLIDACVSVATGKVFARVRQAAQRQVPNVSAERNLLVSVFRRLDPKACAHWSLTVKGYRHQTDCLSTLTVEPEGRGE